MSWYLSGFFLLYIFGLTSASRDGTHEKMYKTLDTNAACFRRLNGTHQFGCSSSRRGDTGIIHFVQDKQDLEEFFKNSTSETYVIALYMNMFTEDVASQLIKATNVGGLLLISQEHFLPDNYSPDGVCPNSRMNSCEGQIINPYGNSFLFVDWPFPMFMVDDPDTISMLHKCFTDFNLPFGESQLSRPLCSVQIKSHMSAAVNTPVCLRRESAAGARVFKYCDPMGDRNILLPLIGSQENLPERSTIVIAARLDTATMFDGVSSGFITAGTSVVTLLSTANILSKLMKNEDVQDKEIIFMILNGEAQDYIGSSRIIYDIKQGEFYESTSMNLTLSNIMAFIEISQIDQNSKVFIHSTNDVVTDELKSKLFKAGSQYSVNLSNSTLRQLPPSSLQVFKKADPSLPGLVIASYDKEYTNKYFNGFLDSAKTITYKHGEPLLPGSLQKNVADISMTLASAVYTTITGITRTISPEDVGNLVDDLLQCYLQTRYCRLMKEVSTGAEGNGPSTTWPMYVSVQPSSNPITTATGLLLAYLTSTPMNISQESCASDSKSYAFYWINGPNNVGLCLNTTLRFTPAMSPAFLIENYNWASGNYSTWTESIWFDFGVEMFLKPSRKKEWITFGVGLAVFVVSFTSVYWLNKRAKEIFSPSRTDCSLLTTNC